MKKNITFYFAILLLSLTIIKESSCKNDANAKYEKPPAKRTILDTTKVIGVFVSHDRKSVLHDIVYKIRFDSVPRLIPTSGSNFKQVWGIDSILFVPKLDTLRDSTGKPVRDEKGDVKFGPMWFQTSNDLVLVSSLNVDTAIKRFQKFLIVDTVGKK